MHIQTQAHTHTHTSRTGVEEFGKTTLIRHADQLQTAYVYICNTYVKLQVWLGVKCVLENITYTLRRAALLCY